MNENGSELDDKINLTGHKSVLLNSSAFFCLQIYGLKWIQSFEAFSEIERKLTTERKNASSLTCITAFIYVLCARIYNNQYMFIHTE